MRRVRVQTPNSVPSFYSVMPSKAEIPASLLGPSGEVGARSDASGEGARIAS